MKIVLRILAALVLLKIALMSASNFGVWVDLQDPLLRRVYHIKEGYIILGSFFGGILFMLGMFFTKYRKMKAKLKKRSRDAEKNLVSAEASEDKIKMLEAKVLTLETALKEALNK